MARPINLYQGGAPATFSQMGQGVAEGIGKVGELYARGISSIANSLGSGGGGGISGGGGGSRGGVGGGSGGGGGLMDYLAATKQAQGTVKGLGTLSEMIKDENMKKIFNQYLTDPSISDIDKANWGTNFLNNHIRHNYLMEIQGQKGLRQSPAVTFPNYTLGDEGEPYFGVGANNGLGGFDGGGYGDDGGDGGGSGD